MPTCCRSCTARSRRRRSRRWRCPRTASWRSPATSGAGCPSATRDISGLETLCCVPVSAAGRWLGVIFADRGGALRAHATPSATPCGRSARRRRSPRASASRRASRAGRGCSRRASTSRASSTSASCSGCSASRWCSAPSTALSEEARRRCADEMHAALADLREALSRPLAPPDARHRRDAARRARAARAPLQGPAARAPLGGGRGGAGGGRVAGPVGARRGAPECRQARAAELGAGARGPARRRLPARGAKRRRARRARRGAGMGLRLAAVEALQRGALVEFGPEGGDWRVRLVVPLEEDSAE